MPFYNDDIRIVGILLFSLLLSGKKISEAREFLNSLIPQEELHCVLLNIV